MLDEPFGTGQVGYFPLANTSSADAVEMQNSGNGRAAYFGQLNEYLRPAAYGLTTEGGSGCRPAGAAALTAIR